MHGFIGNIGTWELVFILLVALIVVGPGKLPDVARSFGKALNEFKKTTSGVQKEFQNALKFEDEPKTKKTASVSDSGSDNENEINNEIETETENNDKASMDETIDISDIEVELKETEEKHNPYQ